MKSLPYIYRRGISPPLCSEACQQLFFFLFVCFSMYWMSPNLFCRPGQAQTHRNMLAFALQVLGLKVYATISCLWCRFKACFLNHIGLSGISSTACKEHTANGWSVSSGLTFPTQCSSHSELKLLKPDLHSHIRKLLLPVRIFQIPTGLAHHKEWRGPGCLDSR